jgi:hypothetical protein
MKKRTFLILTVLSGFLLWGCYPGGAEYTEDLDVVLTSYNQDFDFSTVSTYAMPDRIVKITGDVAEGEAPRFIPDASAAQIISRIESNMSALGWERIENLADGGIDSLANPDVVLIPAAWETTTIFYYYDYWYWWYGGYYPGYYPPMYASSYTTGTLMWTLIDDNEISGTGSPVRQWTAAVNGLLTGSFNVTRINKAIDQAFTQSPYLLTK